MGDLYDRLCNWNPRQTCETRLTYHSLDKNPINLRSDMDVPLVLYVTDYEADHSWKLPLRCHIDLSSLQHTLCGESWSATDAGARDKKHRATTVYQLYLPPGIPETWT